MVRLLYLVNTTPTGSLRVVSDLERTADYCLLESLLLIKAMEAMRRVQLVYHNISLTVTWNTAQVTSDTAIEAFNRLGLKVAEYFGTSSLCFIVTPTQNSEKRPVSIEEVCEEPISPVFTIAKSPRIPPSQCIFELSGSPAVFSLVEYAEILPSGEFIDIGPKPSSAKVRTRYQMKGSKSQDSTKQLEDVKKV